MKLFLRYQSTAPASASPYRLVGEKHQAITWANDFLDAQRIRQLSLRSLRAYMDMTCCTSPAGGYNTRRAT